MISAVKRKFPAVAQKAQHFYHARAELVNRITGRAILQRCMIFLSTERHKTPQGKGAEFRVATKITPGFATIKQYSEGHRTLVKSMELFFFRVTITLV